MLDCSTVAIVTHTRYGVSASVAQRACGQITIIDQTTVTSTMMMSSSASQRLRRPNWIG